MTLNFFSNRDDKLPDLKLQHLPKIKTSLPRIKMSEGNDLLFDIDGTSVSVNQIADSINNLFFE